MELPTLPAHLSEFIPYLAQHQKSPIEALLQPYKSYESKLREIFAQEPENSAIFDPHVNTIPVFNGQQQALQIRARDLATETDAEKETYLLSLSDNDRKPEGFPAIVQSLKEFRANFNLFSESSLVDLDWSNVIAAGSSVVTSLLPVNKSNNKSKRALRQYYHEKLAPASDVDLFIYGLDEKQAVEKIKDIEARIRDAILSETTTIRTKNAITIVSEYPTRHVQIVLRLYKSVSEILTGFDVDCSCVAYDGSQVWASPRALAAFVTQVNTIDLTRRSPSYENRLSKYSHRGFEAQWPQLDRSRIDPTIFERSFSRVMGLARLLVLEKLPHPKDRDDYMAQRRAERGRPELHWTARWRRGLPGNVKEEQPDDVAEWVDEDEVSSYHTFTIPYGPRYNAKKINKLLFTKDLLLNAEWNRPKDRETCLHRHPAFFGSVEDVIADCCGYCPEPVTDEDLAAAEEEEKIYVSGDIQFIKDDPGRQAIGSFNPLTDNDWTEMAYVGNTARLCQAIVDGDIEHVQDWCTQEGVDVNTRDHTGRTPLHLATMCSTLEIVQCLIDNGARLVARIYDGFTALHIAAYRGHTQMVGALLKKSEENEEEEARKKDEKKAARRAGRDRSKETSDQARDIKIETDASDKDENKNEDMNEDDNTDEDIYMVDSDESEDSDRMTEGSFVRVRDGKSPDGSTMPDDSNKDEPDVYDVDVLAWDLPISPLHLAIAGGHTDVIHALVEHFGADVLLPVKLIDEYHRAPHEAILTLVLAMQLPAKEALNATKALLSLGASSSQADMNEITALHYVMNEGKAEILDIFFQYDPAAAKAAINHLSVTGWSSSPRVKMPLLTAIRAKKTDMTDKLLAFGAEPSITQEAFARAFHRKYDNATKDPEVMQNLFETSIDQPITEAIRSEQVEIAKALMKAGADCDLLTTEGYTRRQDPGRTYNSDKSLLDYVRETLHRLNSFNIKGHRESLKPPPTLDSDEAYLEGLTKGTYRYWLAETDLAQARTVSEHQHKEFKDARSDDKSEPGLEQKLQAIQKLAKDFEHLEGLMKTAGARTFYEMNPNFEEPKNEDKPTAVQNQGKKPEPYKTDQNFLVPDINQNMKEGYFRLFQAAWEGDIQTVKLLTMSEWNGANAPLQVAASDLRSFTPFSLAMLRGHMECARCILDITTVQYKPYNKEDRVRYSLRATNSDDDDDSESEMNLYEELVDADYTIEDIGALSKNVKSRVSPMSLIDCQDQELWRFVSMTEREAKKLFHPNEAPYSYVWGDRNSWDRHQSLFSSESRRVRHSLIRYAIVLNDTGMLRFLLEKRRELYASMEDEDASKTYSILRGDFDLAVKLGRNEMLGEIIKCTGQRLPLTSLAKRSGVEVSEKPKYYQGLSVHGKKRMDWADAGRGIFHQQVETLEPPLTDVIFEGNIEPTEYFLSDAPLRRYKEFTETNKSDKRIVQLAQADGGIEKVLSNWLTSQMDLTLHVAIMAEPTSNATAQIEFLIRSFPHLIDHTPQSSKYTPLALALQLRRLSATRLLIAAGADQTARDISGRNLLHIILHNSGNWCSTNNDSNTYIRTVIDLLDPHALRDMFLQRCSPNNPSLPPNVIDSANAGPGSTTPLALWLHSSYSNLDVISLILSYSKGVDLTVMDGAGDYPLHVAVRNQWLDVAKIILDWNPELLYWENATGITPWDIVQKKLLKRRFEGAPRILDCMRIESVLDKWPSEYEREREREERKKADVENEVFNEDGEEWSPDELMEKMFGRHEEKHGNGKRKLVSLYDANEVAKRLATMQKQRNERDKLIRGEERAEAIGGRQFGRAQTDSDGGEEDERNNKVAVDCLGLGGNMYGRARNFKKWDLEREEELERERGEWKDE